MIILAGAGSYRCLAFRTAAERLGIELIEAADIPDPLAESWQGPLAVDYLDIERSAARIAEVASETGAAAVVALDDSGTLVASQASKIANLPHNDPDASLAARDKLVMRRKLREHGAPVPWFTSFPMTASPELVASRVAYPCIVKPTRLSGSRGVIRANDAAECAAAFSRVSRMLVGEGADPEQNDIIVEEYLPGEEVAVEGILTYGQLRVLSIFDKPDPLVGPYFEETIYVTPSRHPRDIQQAIHQRTAEAAAALGIHHGPVHAELRIWQGDAWVIEVAGRSIGGLCSTILEYGAGQSLEELILMNAVGKTIGDTGLSSSAAGVMMIPIPRSGVLKRVDGIDAAREVHGITGIEITARMNAAIDALPEGSSYLGFIFAKAETSAGVEAALRQAHGHLRIRIDPLLTMSRAI